MAPKTPTPERMRRCRACNQDLPEGQFERVAGHVWSKCTPCRQRRKAAALSKERTRVRRHREMRDAGAEPINALAIYRRDGWVCQLCGGPVDRTKRLPDSGAPTLDHITPLALGGRHIKANVQLAHLICNARKGASGDALTDQASG